MKKPSWNGRNGQTQLRSPLISAVGLGALCYAFGNTGNVRNSAAETSHAKAEAIPACPAAIAQNGKTAMMACRP
jgi:hypothetical protein